MEEYTDHVAPLFDGVQRHGFAGGSGLSIGLEPSEHRRASVGSVIFSVDTEGQQTRKQAQHGLIFTLQYKRNTYHQTRPIFNAVLHEQLFLWGN